MWTGSSCFCCYCYSFIFIFVDYERRFIFKGYFFPAWRFNASGSTRATQSAATVRHRPACIAYHKTIASSQHFSHQKRNELSYSSSGSKLHLSCFRCLRVKSWKVGGFLCRWWWRDKGARFFFRYIKCIYIFVPYLKCFLNVGCIIVLKSTSLLEGNLQSFWDKIVSSF